MQILCRKDEEESYAALLNALNNNRSRFIVEKLDETLKKLKQKDEESADQGTTTNGLYTLRNKNYNKLLTLEH